MELVVRVLDLFSGIGGFSLGLERAGMETVAFCEIEEYPRKVLKKHWPNVPIYDDIRTLTAERLKEDGIDDIGLICGGYPCQPFSLAGKRNGEEDDRHLWPEYLRLIRELRPRWVIGENVAGHITMGLDAVLSDLEGEGYTWEAFVIPACAVDAKHRRDRVWIVAHDACWVDRKHHPEPQERQEPQPRESTSGGNVPGPVCSGRQVQQEITDSQNQAHPDHGGKTQSVANTSSKRLQGGAQARDIEREGEERDQQPAGRGERSQPGNWLPEPSVGRVAHGVPRRVDRLKSLGNAVVPQIPEIIGRAIMK